MFVDVGKAVQVSLINVGHYGREEIYASVDQILNPNNPLQDVDETHYPALTEFLCLYKYDYASGMITVNFFRAVRPESVAHESAEHNVDGRKSVKDGYCTVTIHEQHLSHSLEVSRDKDSVRWVADFLRNCYAYRLDENTNSPAQVTKESKVENISAANVQNKATFSDSVHSLFCYTQAFEEDFVVHFVDVHIMDFLDDKMSSNFHALNFRATAVRHISVCRMLNKNKGGLLRLLI